MCRGRHCRGGGAGGGGGGKRGRRERDRREGESDSDRECVGEGEGEGEEAEEGEGGPRATAQESSFGATGAAVDSGGSGGGSGASHCQSFRDADAVPVSGAAAAAAAARQQGGLRHRPREGSTQSGNERCGDADAADALPSEPSAFRSVRLHVGPADYLPDAIARLIGGPAVDAGSLTASK